MLNELMTLPTIPLNAALQNFIFTKHNYSVISEYEIIVYLVKLYKEKIYKNQKIGKISSDFPTKLVIDNNIEKLKRVGTLTNIKNTSVFVIAGREKPAAHQIVCAANPFCYISHFSAIEWHNLTDRILHTIYITQANSNTFKSSLDRKIKLDLSFLDPDNDSINYWESYSSLLHLLSAKPTIPKNIFDKKIEIRTIKNFKNYLPQENSNGVRVTPIGKTFLDMIREPNLCGGFEHVFQVLENFAKKYLPLIIKTFEKEGTNIDRTRLGYLLEEKLNIKHPVFEKWKQKAQRGGSRKLLASKPYDGNNYSEDWKISVNWKV